MFVLKLEFDFGRDSFKNVRISLTFVSKLSMYSSESSISVAMSCSGRVRLWKGQFREISQTQDK